MQGWDESLEAWQRCSSRAGAEPALPSSQIQGLQTAPGNGIPWWQQGCGSCRCLCPPRGPEVLRLWICFSELPVGDPAAENWGVCPKTIKRLHRERHNLMEPRLGLTLRPIQVGWSGNSSSWICRASGISAGSRRMLHFTP